MEVKCLCRELYSYLGVLKNYFDFSLKVVFEKKNLFVGVIKFCET